jgi:hypothetical protein
MIIDHRELSIGEDSQISASPSMNSTQDKEHTEVSHPDYFICKQENINKIRQKIYPLSYPLQNHANILMIISDEKILLKAAFL